MWLKRAASFALGCLVCRSKLLKPNNLSLGSLVTCELHGEKLPRSVQLWFYLRHSHAKKATIQKRKRSPRACGKLHVMQIAFDQVIIWFELTVSRWVVANRKESQFYLLRSASHSPHPARPISIRLPAFQLDDMNGLSVSRQLQTINRI